MKNLLEKLVCLCLFYELDNMVVEKFYVKYGFEKMGEIIDGEVVVDLWFKC